MNWYKNRFKNLVLMVIVLFLIMALTMPIEAQWALTQEEKDYIANAAVIKAVSLDRIAPLQYVDVNGEIRGISIHVLEEISEMTGLKFEYQLYDSLNEVLNSDFDIYFCATKNYAPKEMILSQPYLKSETILYINSSLDSNQLDGKTYAAIRGSTLPEGIKEENAIYFDTREESLDAVNAGQADYGYGNAYSVAFYTLQNGYKNIITVPKGKEIREYCMGFLKKDEILISIINKAISEIDEKQIQNIILDVATHVDRKITFSMIMNLYGEKIFIGIFIVMCILLYNLISNVRIKKKLKMQNTRYKVLAHISNEYIYEYLIKENYLELSEKFIQLFGNQEIFNEASQILKNILTIYNISGDTSTIELPLADGSMGVFKVINSSIYDSQGELVSIIGKLIDISEEVAEKEELIAKSQVDGLTGLYNAATTKELIIERLKSKDKHKLDAFIIMDCDKFKDINDTYGHLTGNQILESLSKNLKESFRNTDIIGRIGGDEFCVYIKDVPSIEFLREKCQQLSIIIPKAIEDVYASFSFGISLVEDEKTYEDLFKEADSALYEAKRRGKGEVVVYEKRN